MRLIILSLLFSIQLNCNAQNNKKFNQLLNKFSLLVLPIDPSSLDGGEEISKKEFNKFFNLNPGKWKYIDFTYYNAIARINLNKCVGLIFQRWYDPEEYTGTKKEIVLCIYDRNGEIKSFLVIDGFYITENSEDYVYFKLKANLELEITTENRIYGKEKPTIYSNFYKINPDTGEIVEISK
ncbi:hypothetical protein E0494_10645 [Marinilabiliaceae bacterium JC040]|nr:hypothetical protein [Marinilabiliaceae bacterium JC040]